MIKSYLKVALRNILRNPGYAGINIFGLTVGITCFILIFLVVRYELSFDKSHQDSAKIFRIDNELRLNSGNYKYPTCASAIAPALLENSPEVEAYTRLLRVGNNQSVVRIEDQYFKQRNVFAADASFYDFFSFDIIHGDGSVALEAPNMVVLTESAARKYFGNTDAVGKILTLTGQPSQDYKVTAVMKDLPANSHIQFEMLLSLVSFKNNNDGAFLNSWNNDGFYSYIKLNQPSSAALVSEKLMELREKHTDENNEMTVNPNLVAMEDIHLYSNLRNEIVPNGNIDFIYIFSAIAIFILLIASINYMNLATARSAKRAQEVGVRKVLGAYKKQLVSQFLGESMVLTLMATVISIIVLVAFLPQLAAFTGKALTATMLADELLIGILLLVILLIGFGSGSYPALFLSSFKPVTVLKGKIVPGMGSSAGLRKGLVVFQFAISIVLMIGTYVVYNQLSFMRNKSLGYEKDNIVMISNSNNAITPQLNTFRNQLMAHHAVEGVTATFSKPGGLRPIFFVKSETLPDENNLNLAGINTDFEFMKTMGIRLIAGRDFDPQIPTDSTEAIIINKKGATELNLGEDPIGKMIEVNLGGDFVKKRVIGLVDNINFEPLQRKTESCFYGPIFPAYAFVFVKVNPDHVNETLSFIESEWDRFAPDQPFEYSFLEEELNQLYQSEEKLSEIIIYFALLAIMIACLGLFGLASFSTEQRIKEIGVRKVLGASVSQILLLLTKDFALLIVIAFVIAAPASYYLVDWWLQNFAFQISLSALTFLIAGVGALLIALLTVGYKTIRAAQANPIKSLRYE